LREAPIPRDPAAEARGLDLALDRHARRRPPRRSPLPRLTAVLAVVLALGALLLTPAWAAVRDWVGGAFESTPAHGPPTGLGTIPGGGRLLVQTSAGAWIVEPGGARHLLGGYQEASWSPHGLFLATVSGERVSAVAPDGEPHWTIHASAPVADPRWSPSGELVAYRSGPGLRVVAGDGSEDRALDESVAPVAPAWDPRGRPDLAYVDARGALRVLDSVTGHAAATVTALPGIRDLEWADGSTGRAGRDSAGGKAGAVGGVLLEVSARRLRVRAVALGSAGHGRLGHPRELSVGSGETVRAAPLSPYGRSAAALLARRGDAAPRVVRTDLVVFSTATGAGRRLGSVPGRLTEVAWSPRGNRLLVAWPTFDEWLFVPPHFAEGKAMTGIAAAFRTPAGAPFPTVSGWCCRARSPAAP
jgi:hypothetical protein